MGGIGDIVDVDIVDLVGPTGVTIIGWITPSSPATMVAPGAARPSSTLDDGTASSDVIGNTTVASTGADWTTVGVLLTISRGIAVTVGVEAPSDDDSPSAGVENDI